VTWRDALAVPGALSEAECGMLAHLAAETDAIAALEVGHYYGRSTVVLLESLPVGVPLFTVDHHKGDDWCPPAPVEEFNANIAPHVGDRLVAFSECDMLAVDYELAEYGFVLYDADHHAKGFALWWELVRPHLADECTLVFDDADWDEQSMLHDLDHADGFRSIRTLEFFRGPKDKHSPETYTLEVMQRG
jgi:hypothetical protein